MISTVEKLEAAEFLIGDIICFIKSSKNESDERINLRRKFLGGYSIRYFKRRLRDLKNFHRLLKKKSSLKVKEKSKKITKYVFV